MGWSSAVPWDAIINNNNDTWQNLNQTGYSKSQKVLSQQGIDKIVYDIMSSDQGLGALSRGENLSGGFGSTTKTLLAQDLIAKIAGEIANVTAPTITESTKKEENQNTKRSAIGGQLSVICTEFARTGELDWNTYKAGDVYFRNLPYYTVVGYYAWATSQVSLIKKNSWYRAFMLRVVRSRYNMILNRKFGFLGAVTIYLGEPLCYLIGRYFVKGNLNGSTLA